MDKNEIEEIGELKDIYEFSDEEAIEIIKSVAKRMLDELLNLALRSSVLFDEESSVKYTGEILRYFLFLSDDTGSTYPVNGRLFKEADLIRLLQFYGTYIENEKISKSNDEQAVQKLTEEAELLNQLKSQIFFSVEYNPPARGMQGLLGTYKTRKEIEEEQSRKVQTNVKQSKQQVDFSGN